MTKRFQEKSIRILVSSSRCDLIESVAIPSLTLSSNSWSDFSILNEMPPDARAQFVLFLDSDVINVSNTFTTMIAHSRSIEYRHKYRSRNIVSISRDIAIPRRLADILMHVAPVIVTTWLISQWNDLISLAIAARRDEQREGEGERGRGKEREREREGEGEGEGEGDNSSRSDVDVWLTAQFNLSYDDTERNETISRQQR